MVIGSFLIFGGTDLSPIVGEQAGHSFPEALAKILLHDFATGKLINGWNFYCDIQKKYGHGFTTAAFNDPDATTSVLEAEIREAIAKTAMPLKIQTPNDSAA
jgi:hypothetical protein